VRPSHNRKNESQELAAAKAGISQRSERPREGRFRFTPAIGGEGSSPRCHSSMRPASSSATLGSLIACPCQ